MLMNTRNCKLIGFLGFCYGERVAQKIPQGIVSVHPYPVQFSSQICVLLQYEPSTS